MPRLLAENPQERETVCACAPWWNGAPDPAAGPATVIERAKHGAPLPEAARVLEDDGDFVYYERDYDHAPHERVELYRFALHGDLVWVQGKVKSLKTVGKKTELDQEQLARSNTLGFVRRVTCMTDPDGHVIPLNEGAFRRMPTSDTNFLQAVIDLLEEPLIPVLAEDYAKAEKAAVATEHALTRHADAVARGFSVGQPPEPLDLRAYAEGEALERTFRRAESDL